MKQRYKQSIKLYNDINTAAVGYYATHLENKNLFFLFQAISLKAGAGLIVNGKLIEGFCNLAGEFSQKQEELSKTPEGTLEIVSKIILTTMYLVAPEVIVIFSELLPDFKVLEKKIKELMPQHQIPKLIKVNNVIEYMLIGQMYLCLKEAD